MNTVISSTLNANLIVKMCNENFDFHSLCKFIKDVCSMNSQNNISKTSYMQKIIDVFTIICIGIHIII